MYGLGCWCGFLSVGRLIALDFSGFDQYFVSRTLTWYKCGLGTMIVDEWFLLIERYGEGEVDTRFRLVTLWLALLSDCGADVD